MVNYMAYIEFCARLYCMRKLLKDCLHLLLVFSISFFPIGAAAGKGGSAAQHVAHSIQSSEHHFEIVLKQGSGAPDIVSQQSMHKCSVLRCDSDCSCGSCFNAINDPAPLISHLKIPFVLVVDALFLGSPCFPPPFRPPRA